MSRDVACYVSTFEGTCGGGVRLKAISTIKIFLPEMLPYCYKNLNIIYTTLQSGETSSSLLSEVRLTKAHASHQSSMEKIAS